MNIIATCKMGPGTLEAKFIPLSKRTEIDIIFILRKHPGPEIYKVSYIVLPKVCRFKILEWILSPILLAYHAKKTKSRIIISYHIIPYAFYAFFASLLTGIPYIVAQTGLLIQKQYLNRFNRSFIKIVIKQARFLFVPGHNSKQFWSATGIDNNKIRILHSTIDVNRFKPKYAQKQFDFIFLGRLDVEKNIPFIINSFETLAMEGLDFKFVLVGNGRQHNELIYLVNKIGLNEKIVFAGFQNNVEDWLNQSRVMLLASISEGLPTALMQAMACELVCISSNVGNIPDLINSETGYLFAPGDNKGLTSILRNILKNNFSTDSITKNARTHIINHHSHESAVIKWGEVLPIFEKTI